MRRSLNREVLAKPARRGYALLLVVVVLAGLSILIGLVGRVAATAAREHRSRRNHQALRWAADAAVEEAIWRLAQGNMDHALREDRFATSSNGCSVDVTVRPLGPRRVRVAARARPVAREEQETERVAARAVVTAVVETDPAARTMRIISWREGDAADGEEPAPTP